MNHFIKKSLLKALLIAISTIGINAAHATQDNRDRLDKEYAQYRATGGNLIGAFKDCSIKYDQFSQSNHTCLKSVEASIVKQVAGLYSRNKTYYESDPFLSNLYGDKDGYYAQLKDSCEKTFPEPLQRHFKNQILSCKVQIDLNKYFLFANELF